MGDPQIANLSQQSMCNQMIVEAYDKSVIRSAFERIALSWCKLRGIEPQAKTPDGPFIEGMIEHMKMVHEAIEDAGYEIVEKKHDN